MSTSALGLRYPSLSDAPNVPQDFGNLVADLETLLNAGWSTYTPTWVGATTNPTIGNGSITGSYRRVGTHLVGFVSVICGSTTTFGSGGYTWTTPSGMTIVERNTTIGIGALHDASAGVYYVGAVNRSNTNTFHLRCHGTGLAANGTPVTLASGDSFRIMYETEVTVP